jgi:hypothetical protein
MGWTSCSSAMTWTTTLASARRTPMSTKHRVCRCCPARSATSSRDSLPRLITVARPPIRRSNPSGFSWRCGTCSTRRLPRVQPIEWDVHWHRCCSHDCRSQRASRSSARIALRPRALAANVATPAGIRSGHQSVSARASNRALILAVWVWLSRRMVMTTKAVVIAGFRKRLDQFFPAAVVASLELIK